MLKPLIAQMYCAWPWDLDLWPFNIEQLFYTAGYVTNPATKFEDPTAIRSCVPRPWFACSLYNFYWATTTIKGRLLSSRFRAKKILGPVEMVPKIAVSGEMGSKPYVFVSRPTKGTSLRGTYFASKSVRASRPLPFSSTKKLASHFVTRGTK